MVAVARCGRVRFIANMDEPIAGPTSQLPIERHRTAF